MAETNRTYSGCANYETWLVKVWIGNTSTSHEFWRGVTRSCRDNAKVSLSWQTKRSAARILLTELLEETVRYIERPESDVSTIYSDLLGAALAEVDWREIADSLLYDLEFDEMNEGGDDEQT